jgi:hypothetical protein
MVGIAEANPSVQLVASYKIHGKLPVCEGPFFPQQVLDGREVCSRFFEGTLGFLGSPTDHLIRMPTLIEGGRLFDEAFLHADIEFWVRLLKGGASYGFVHQILTFTRVHEGAVSGFAHVMGSGPVEFLAMLLKHGESFLSEVDYRRLVKIYRRRYSRFLFRALLKAWDRRIWKYQVENRKKFGIDVGLVEVLRAGVRESSASVMTPLDTLQRLRREQSRTAAARR